MFKLCIERRGGAPEGIIAVGEHTETYPVDLSVWDVPDYRANWLRAAAHVLEHGYGRFLGSVSSPGRGAYLAWVCRARGAEAMLFKSVLLPSLTESFANPRDAETLDDDFAERNQDEPNLIVHRCALADIAAFEASLHGADAN